MNKKYYYLLLVLIIAGLGWYFWPNEPKVSPAINMPQKANQINKPLIDPKQEWNGKG